MPFQSAKQVLYVVGGTQKVRGEGKLRREKEKEKEEMKGTEIRKKRWWRGLFPVHPTCT